jgi:hypothetical protein
MAALAKIIDDKDMIQLATEIKRKHALINREADELDAMKITLLKVATEEFYKELRATCENGKPVKILDGVPKVYGNLEIPVDNNDKVTVNFQLSSKSFSKIDGKPASNILKGIFGVDTYEKIFEEKNKYTITSTPVEIAEEAKLKPELFGYRVLPDADKEELRKLQAEHPDLVEQFVVNNEEFAKAFPAAVDTEVEVAIVSGFLEKVGKVDNHVLESAKKFLVGLFGATLKSMVKCGNANKK